MLSVPYCSRLRNPTKAAHVSGVVLVDGRVQPRANEQGQVGRIAEEEQQRRAEQNGQGASIGAVEMEGEPRAASHDGQSRYRFGIECRFGEHDHGTDRPHRDDGGSQIREAPPYIGVERDRCSCSQHGDLSGRLRTIGENRDVEQPPEANPHNHENEPPEFFVGEPREDEQRRDGEQAHHVNAAAEPEQIGQQKQPAVVRCTVLGAVPVDDEPHA